MNIRIISYIVILLLIFPAGVDAQRGQEDMCLRHNNLPPPGESGASASKGGFLTL